MPSGSGLSVREMRVHDKEMPYIPVIMLTGKSDEATIRRCHEVRAFYVLKTPCTAGRLRVGLLRSDRPTGRQKSVLPALTAFREP
ncbi:MAG: response regulator [Pirellulaceae bacterium]|nr:response regulator [Pirellulaceae bacterium]